MSSVTLLLLASGSSSWTRVGSGAEGSPAVENSRPQKSQGSCCVQLSFFACFSVSLKSSYHRDASLSTGFCWTNVWIYSPQWTQRGLLCLRDPGPSVLHQSRKSQPASFDVGTQTKKRSFAESFLISGPCTPYQMPRHAPVCSSRLSSSLQQPVSAGARSTFNALYFTSSGQILGVHVNRRGQPT